MLATFLYDQIARDGEKPAIVFGDDTLSYRELVSRIQEFILAMDNLGVRNGDHVAMWLPNAPVFVVAFFAITRLGAIAVPLNPASRRGDVIVPENGFRYLVSTPELLGGLTDTLSEHGGALKALTLIANPQGILIDSAPGDPLPRAFSPRSPAEAAILQVSSGSTGIPKPLYRTHGQCVAEADHFHRTCATSTDDIFLCALPLYHAHGLGNAMLAAIRCGGTLIIMPRSVPFSLYRREALGMLKKRKITVFPAVPFMIEALAELEDEDLLLPCLRLCFTAGSPLPERSFRIFLSKFEVAVRQLYGCTEAGSVAINQDNDPCEAPESVGRAMASVDLRIVAPDGTACPPDVEGEIAIRSASLCEGYALEHSGGNKDFRDSWFFTGDIGRCDRTGRLTIVGRKQFVVEIAGHKVHLPEIEAIIASQPSVSDVAVVGLRTSDGRQFLQAYIVPTGDFNAEKFFRDCRRDLSGHKCPEKVRLLPRIPKNALGKIARNELARMG